MTVSQGIFRFCDPFFFSEIDNLIAGILSIPSQTWISDQDMSKPFKQNQDFAGPKQNETLNDGINKQVEMNLSLKVDNLKSHEIETTHLPILSPFNVQQSQTERDPESALSEIRPTTNPTAVVYFAEADSQEPKLIHGKEVQVLIPVTEEIKSEVKENNSRPEELQEPELHAFSSFELRKKLRCARRSSRFTLYFSAN